MKKILVLGGTRFFGTHLVNSLLEDGHQVTVATRGNVTPHFKSEVHFEIADRNKIEDLRKLAQLGPFDIIYDQICMSAKNANDACVAFSGVCRKYVFTSTGSVYDSTDCVKLEENLFNPLTYKINLEETSPYNYQEAKRQAEAVFYQTATFNVAMVRFPIVLGQDDYTNRLKFHVENINTGKEIYFPNLNTKMGFIRSDEAGEFLKFIGIGQFKGAINAVSTGYISMKELVELIEKKSGKSALLALKEGDTNHSPFGFGHDFMMPNILGSSLGFKFKNLNDYLPELIDYYLIK
jgi:nucleoside-diphosphate-sugar epimerase